MEPKQKVSSSISGAGQKRQHYLGKALCNRSTYCGISGASLVAQLVKNLPAMKETQVQSLGQEEPLEKTRLTSLVFLPEEFHGQRNLVGYSTWCHKEAERTEWLTLSLHSLERDRAFAYFTALKFLNIRYLITV